mgnify:CR=1 FL=1
MGIRLLKKAIKNTDEFVWYITYMDVDAKEQLLTLYASSARKAAKKAERKLREMYGVWYKIKSISTV